MTPWLLKNFRFERIDAFPQKDDPNNRVFIHAKLPTVIFVLKKEKVKSVGKVICHPGKRFEDVSKKYILDQQKIQLLDSYSLSIPIMNDDEWAICKRIFLSNWVTKLGTILHSYQGEINETSMKHLLSEEPIGPVILRGGVVQRYDLLKIPKQGKKYYLDGENYEREISDASRKIHANAMRIGYQRNAALDNYRRLIATIIPQHSHLFDSISYLLPSDDDRHFLLSVLNSNLLEFRFRMTSSNNHVNGYEVEQLPIRIIHETTPTPQRQSYFVEAQELFRAYLSSKDPSILLSFIDDRLPMNEKGNFITEKEESDVVHDLLGFLAEQMIDLNEQKQQEVRGFLEWLEREIGAKVDDLTNKTAIKQYYDFENFIELINILEKKPNAKKLRVNPHDRGFQDNILKPEFIRSKEKLIPIRESIESTDRLIDQIVYKLYGLTDEEIAIVEKSLA